MEESLKPENTKIGKAEVAVALEVLQISIETAKSLFEAGSLIEALEELTISGEALWDRGEWTEAETQIYDGMQKLASEIEALLLK